VHFRIWSISTAKFLAFAVLLSPATALPQDISTFNLPSQPLADSLRAVASQTSSNILFERSLVSGLMAKPLKATLTIDEALKQLLVGTGLAFRKVDERTVMIVRLNSAAVLQDGTVQRIADGSNSDATSRLRAPQPNTAETRAQDNVLSTESRSDQLDDIVVTARKRQENIEIVPLAITALSGSMLKEQGVTRMVDLQGQVPSLYLQQAIDDPQSLTFAMRGQKQNDVTLAVDPSVGLYIDGLYYPRTHGMRGALVDVDRVEVLRGPQGTLYGRNTTGGAIAFYTKNPTDTYGSSVALSAGNYNAWNLIGIANIPLTTDLAARFVVQGGKHDGYGHDLRATHDLDFEDNGLVRGKLRAQLGDKVVALLSASYQANRAGGQISKFLGITPPTATLPAGGALTQEIALETGMTIPQTVAYLQSFVNAQAVDFYGNSGLNSTYSNVHRTSIGLDIAADLPHDLRFRSITGYENLLRSSYWGNPLPNNFNTLSFYTPDAYYSQEFQLLGGNSYFNWVTGIYGGLENGIEYGSTVFLPILTNNIPFIMDPTVKNDSLAGFAQGVWEFAPSWHVTGGARYSWDRRGAIMRNKNGTTCAVPAPGVESTLLGPSQCPRTYSNDFTSPNWLLSLDKQVTEDLFAYIKYATGYRSGGQNIGGSTQSESFVPFAPETIAEYEVGIKTELFSKKLRVNLAAFHDNYNGIQRSVSVATADGNFSNREQNAATGKVEGIEAEIHLKATSALTLNLDGSLTNARYKKYTDIFGNDFSHQTFGIPKWLFGAGAHYVESVPLGSLALNVDYHWRSTTVLDPAAIYLNQVTQKAYGLLDGRLELNLDQAKVEIALFGQNITGVQYIDSALNLDSVFGFNYGYVAPPRTYGVEITKRFGSF
jgi:iron complex outermembrane recepter protein